ncbi:MAG TPA: hypothetical protein VLB50_02125 [Ignavibacteriaceae bacterium]|nr:hypothetical protein [Ignavibacteriaceae bacterium]
MKPGCFLKSIILLTILVAGIMYIVQHKSMLFFEPGKKIVAGLVMDNWKEEFGFVKNTPEKIKLKEMLHSYIKNLKYENAPDEKEIKRIADMIKTAARDSVITDIELGEISNNLKMKQDYERPE